jgi:Predicted membrane protein (DUF2079)
MSEVTAPAAITAPPAAPPPSPDPLLRIRWIGYGLLGLQLIGFLIWSAILFGHFAVTWDFATYEQPWYLVAHGNFDPFSTISRIPFWQNDTELMPWVLAPFYWIFRSGLTLAWLQDLSIVVAELVVFSWICDVAKRRDGRRDAVLLTSLGLVLLLANPWTWWTVSFDVHEEVLVIAFVALLVRDLARGSRRIWIWTVPVLLGGAPTTSYLIGIGIGGVIASRKTRAMGAGIVLAGLAYSVFIVVIHGDVGVPLPQHFGYLTTTTGATPPDLTYSGLLKGLAAHPLSIPETLWSKRADMIANLAPGGLIGLGAPLLLPLLLVVTLTNTLSIGYHFAEPLFQSIPIYMLMPVGTVIVLAWILRRHRRTALALGGILAAQAIGWAAVWGPVTPTQWLRVPGSTAATLASLNARIPASDEVLASQGVVGGFSSRTHIYGLSWQGTFPLYGQSWFILVPNEGVEQLSPGATKTLIGLLAGPWHARLVTHQNGVWAFVFNPPPRMKSFNVPGNVAPLPAWTSPGVAGKAVLTGPESTWDVTSTGARGYVADQLEWQAPPGRYVADVTLDASGPVNVEVWNNTGNILLARRTITPTYGTQTIALPVNATTPYLGRVYSGWGPFQAQFVPPPAGERIEVRVWSPGDTFVSVYSADLSPATAAG